MTRTDIANLALSKLGAEPITNLATSDTKEGIHARLWYDQTLREVLRSHFWNFAMVPSKIAAVPDTDQAASGTLGRLNGEVLIEAVTAGSAGNSIVVAVESPALETAVEVTGYNITLIPTYTVANVSGTLAYDGTAFTFSGDIPRPDGFPDRPTFLSAVPEAITWDEQSATWTLAHANGAIWTSSDNVASPDLVRTWTPGADTTGTPTVTVGISSASTLIAAATASEAAAALATFANATGSDGSAQVVPGDTVTLAGGISKAVDWQAAFPMPADFLKLREVTDSTGARVDAFDIRRVNGARCLLASGLDVVVLEYVQLVDEPDDYDPLFVTALSTLLAARLALAITGSKEYETTLLGRYLNEDLPAARVADGQDTRSNENRSMADFLAGDLLSPRGMFLTDYEP